MFCSIPLLFGPLQSSCAADDYLGELRQDARELNLAAHPTWRTILHYRRGLFGLRSLNDDPTNFLAEDGPRNPQAELDASLAAFFRPAGDNEDEQHPQCRFRARYSWLKRTLGFDSKRLAEQPCLRYREWAAALAPHGVTLLYPSSYLNNPASMFGHTLLRIDTAEQNEQTRMLAYAANYGAAVGDAGGLEFTLRGLTGGFKGSFTVSPYYALIKKYSDLEHRDIWEYRLSLSPEESRQLTELLWELGSSYFDYYFLDENCSYHLLYLLEYVRPELALSSRFRGWAIPADTVKAVAGAPGMIEEVRFRPSAATVLRRRLVEASDQEQQLAYDLALGLRDLDGINEDAENPALVLELAEQYVGYLLAAGEGERAELEKRAYRLLLARSRVEIPSPFSIPPRPAVAPHEGHGSSRLGFGAGSEEEQLFAEYSYRPAYHDLLDPAGGYLSGAEIDVMALTLRQYEGRGLELERFTPVAIRSIAARDRFIKPVSWMGAVEAARRRLDSRRGTYAFALRGGPGLAYRALPRLLVFGFGYGAAEYSPGFDSGGASLGAGVIAGAAVDWSERSRLLFEADAARYAAGQDAFVGLLTAGWNISLLPALSLRLSASRETEFENDFTQARGMLYVYF